MSAKAYRGTIVHCLADPGDGDHGDAVQILEDGLLIVSDGRVERVGPHAALSKSLGSDVELTDYRGHLIIPGMVDCHIHYPQTDVIASYGTQLLDWLETYTFPAEARFADRALAEETAEFFVDELLRNGTTTALVFATVHPHSVDALFNAAARYNLRIGAGKVLMDRHCPDNLRDTAESGYRDSRALIERWHGSGRAHYAITPRFAPTSSDEQLRLAGQLADEFPDVLVHTHLAENTAEVAWVRELFPAARSYLDVYRQANLLRERAVFAHGLHLDDDDCDVLGKAGGAIAFCPTSNLFLGSGLFDLARADQHGIRTGFGTDIGGGTSFSLQRTAAEAYKVLQLQKQSLTSFRALYLATLGGARALYMDQDIGNFASGKEADFVVLRPNATALMKRRMAATQSIDESLFVQYTIGDERSVAATYVMGQRCYAA